MIRPQSCPICRQVLPPNSASELASYPFCSDRCREVDLYRWSQGKYAIVDTMTAEHFEKLADQLEEEADVDSLESDDGSSG